MTKSTRAAYRCLFLQFQGAAVKKCMFDFELQARNGWLDVFPDGEAAAGLFHLQQSIKKHARDGPKTEKSATLYRQLYRADSFYRILSRKLASLAFLPVPMVPAGFQVIVQEVADRGGIVEQGSPHHCCRQLLKYYQQYYIGVDGLLGEDPMFPISMWNMRDRVTKNEEISNAGLESGNARWNKLVGLKQPEFCRVVQKLALVEMPHYRMIRRELLVGNAKKAEYGVKKWAKFHANIRSIIADFDADRMTMSEFLNVASGQISIVADMNVANAVE